MKKLLDKKTPSPKQLAKEKGVSLKTIRKQLKQGISVEKEHTSKTPVAKEIALDHLKELPDYYTRLKKMEEEYYYHGTSSDSANKIRQSGINPENSKYNKTTFLTKSQREAEKYAKIANNGKRGVIFRVHKKHLNKDDIASDHSGIIQYKGSIHKDHLTNED